MSRRQVVVPQVVQREDRLERQVGEVGDRAVGVQVVVVLHVERPAVVDAVGAEDRGVSHVAHTAEEEVRRNAHRNQGEQRDHEEPRAAARGERPLVARAAEAELRQPQAQVDQGWVGERDAGQRVPVVEQDHRRAER